MFNDHEQKLLNLHPQMVQKLGPNKVLEMHMEGNQRGFLPTRGTRFLALSGVQMEPTVDVNIFHQLSELPNSILERIPHLRLFQEFLQVIFQDDVKELSGLIAQWQSLNALNRFDRLLNQFDLNYKNFSEES